MPFQQLYWVWSFESTTMQIIDSKAILVFFLILLCDGYLYKDFRFSKSLEKETSCRQLLLPNFPTLSQSKAITDLLSVSVDFV